MIVSSAVLLVARITHVLSIVIEVVQLAQLE